MRILFVICPDEKLPDAVSVVVKIADATRAKITLLDVHGEAPRKFYAPFSLGLKSVNEVKKTDVVQKISAVLRDYELIKKARCGEFISQILDEAEKGGYDLLVYSDIDSKLTKKLAEYAHMPVLIVKRKADMKNFLVCTDGSKYAEKAIKFAGELAKKLNAEITLLSVARNKEEVELRKEALAHGAKILDAISHKNYYTRLEVGSARELITEVSKDYDLVSLAPRGLSKLKRILVGHVSLHVLKGSQTNVLLVR